LAQSTPQHAREGDATSPGTTENNTSSSHNIVSPEDEPFGDAEALELVEFNPTVECEDEQIPPQSVLAYLEKHFMKCPAVLDNLVKELPKP